MHAACCKYPAQVLRRLLHMPHLMPEIQTFPVLSAVLKANLSGACAANIVMLAPALQSLLVDSQLA